MCFRVKGLLLSLVFLFALPLFSWADNSKQSQANAAEKGPAILLVTFGTSVPEAQAAFVNIEKQVKASYPNSEIRWAYTSHIIRKKLAKSGTVIDSPEIAMAKLLDDGYGKVVVQSLHMIPGFEFEEMANNLKLFEQMTKGGKVVVSPPLLSSEAAMDKMIKALLADVIPKERRSEEAVLFMGHGTHHPSDAVYATLMHKMQQMDGNIYIGTIDGHPTFAEVKEAMVKKGVKKAYLIPLMTVAGTHALNDMAGSEPDSWKSLLAREGIESAPLMKGLAEFDSLVALWLENLKGAMNRLN